MRDDFLKFIHERGRITKEQYDALNALRRSRNYFGVVALRRDYASAEQLAEALGEQSRLKSRERIGAIMKRRNFMTDEQIRDVLRRQKNTPGGIGQLLVDMEILSADELREEMEAYKQRK